MDRPAYLAGFWGEAWRLGFALVAGIAFYLVNWGSAYFAYGGEYPKQLAIPIVVDLLAGLLAILLAGLRRRFPLVIAVLESLISAISFFSLGACLLVWASLGTRRKAAEIIPIGVLACAGSLAGALAGYPVQTSLDPVSLAMGEATTLAVFAVPTLVGVNIGNRRELVASLQASNLALKEAQSARVAQARSEERTAIAMEMHDALAHRLSLVAVYAGAMENAHDWSAEKVQQSAGVVRENTRKALEELRSILGVLHEDDGIELQPGFAAIPGLLSDARRAGTEVEVRMEEEMSWETLPEAAGTTVYRILQECLTNARKHAPGQKVEIAVGGEPGAGLALDVENEIPSEVPATVPSGYGLVGLAQRARLAGGALSAGRKDGRFAVHLELPWIS
ncbi:MAG: histidine kinase [Propionibacteriaceae bacterium]|nr:histidine kinase [Propionibacteriaceae bacterium]